MRTLALVLMVAACTGEDGKPGEAGQPGDPGVPGAPALTRTAAEPAGEHCPFGGIQVEVGTDGDAMRDLSPVRRRQVGVGWNVAGAASAAGRQLGARSRTTELHRRCEARAVEHHEDLPVIIHDTPDPLG